MTQAVDSFSPHTERSAAALAQGGYVAALRYHYNLTSKEVKTLHAAGVAVGLIAEFDTRTWHPPIDNPETGPEHGRRAVQIALALGFPPGSVIWLTQDTDLHPGDYTKALGYWDGGDDVIRGAGYRVGAYAESLFGELLLDRGKADLLWEVGAYGWSGYYHSPRACMRQLVAQPTIGGVTVDLNDVYSTDCGFWLPSGQAQQPTNPTPPPVGGQPQEGHGMLCILYFKDKPERWLFGHNGTDYFCHYIDTTEELALLEGCRVPPVELGAKSGGSDWLDQQFHRLTGL